jgi:hypothetical protein
MTGTTPIYGIRFPNSTTKVKDLGAELGVMGGDIEAALQAAGISPVVSGQVISAKTDAARDTYFGKPTTEAERLALQIQGPVVVRTDKGWTEQYYATYNAATNPQGATPAGWYPVSGQLPIGVLAGGSDQSIPNAVSAMTPPTTLLPVQSLVNMTGQAAVLTAPIAGLYRATANITWLNNATGARLIYFRDQAGAVRFSYSAGGYATAQGTTGTTVYLKLVAGNTLSPVLYQNSGAALNAIALGSQFALEYVGVPK